MSIKLLISFYISVLLVLFITCELDNMPLSQIENNSSKTIKSELNASLLKQTNSLVINELYVSGSINTNFYPYDQFIELYNPSDTTLYLDGLIISRVGSNAGISIPIRSFQFTGIPLSGREYPLLSGEYCVIAKDACDHNLKTSGTGLDLSNVDWEFFSTEDNNDIDNPDIPNLHNIHTENYKDFFFNLYNDAIILSNGYNTVWEEGIDELTIIDAVEYSADENQIKFLNISLDSSYTGMGIYPYSGKSFERKFPGIDTDNSFKDFHILDSPSPGK